MNKYRITQLEYPLNDSDAVTKKYLVDNFIEKSGDYMHGILSMGGGGIYHEIIGVKDASYDHSVVTKKYVDSGRTTIIPDDFLKLDGSKVMAGSINMNNNRIYNLKLPIDNSDVATKAYVDSHSSSQNVSFEHISEFLTYNGNTFYLVKQAAKRSDYVLFKQDKNLVHTNDVNLFNFLTNSELVFRKGGLWDIILLLNIRTIQKTMLMCEVWSQNDSGKFIQMQTIQYILNNTNNIAKLLFFKFSTTIHDDEFFKVYIRDNGNTFEGGEGSFVFIQENRENSKFKKLEVEEATIKDLTVSDKFVLPNKFVLPKNGNIKC